MALLAVDIGDNVQLRAVFRAKSTGNKVDPPVVLFKVLDAVGNETEYTYGTDVEVERMDEGDYRAIVPAEISGVSVGGVEAIDTTPDNRSGVEEKQFRVRRSAFGNGDLGGGGGGNVIDGGTA